MTTSTSTTAPAESLRGLAGGGVFLPGDLGYDEARTPWNVAANQRPAAVALPHSASEVAALVRAAVAAGLRVAPQSSGHGAAPLAAQDLADVVIVRTSQLDRHRVDPESGTARVEGGALWLPVVEAAAAHGLTGLHGSSPDVGVAGYSLGGGMGWYARRLGLACNSLIAVELVTAGGDLVRADATHEPDLFWALRGGGGNFGVVTALEMRLYPIDTAYAGWLAWDIADAEKVLSRWADWAATAPDHVTTSFRVLRLPPLPEIPEPLRGRELAVVDGAVLGSDEEGETLLAAFRELGPELDTFARVPALSLTRLHQDPEGATPFVAEHCVVSDLSEAACRAYLDQVGPDADAPLLAAELRQLGGAVSRPDPDGGALSHLEGAAALFAVGMAFTPDMGAESQACAAALVEALNAFSDGHIYLNFAEGPADPSAAFDAATWQRLVALRAAVDAGDAMVANHRIPGTSR